MDSRTLSDVERGQQMKDMRKRAGMTQRQVAALFGMTASAVSEWERGNTTPEWTRLRPLDDAYGAGGALLAMFGDAGAVTQYDALSARVRAIEDRMAEVSPSAPQPALTMEALDERLSRVEQAVIDAYEQLRATMAIALAAQEAQERVRRSPARKRRPTG